MKASVLRHIIFTFLVSICTSAYTQEQKLYRLDSIAEQYFQNSNYQKAVDFSKEGVGIAEKLNSDSMLIRLYLRMSYSADYLGFYDLCQEYNFQLLELYEKTKNRSGVGSALNDIGIIHYYKDEYQQALKYAFKALEIYKSLDDSAGIAMCYNNIANSNADNTDYKKGLEYYFKALEINKKLNDYDGIVMCLGNIGETYFEMEQFEKASEYYNEAEKLGLKHEVDIWYMITPYLGIAHCGLENNDVLKALDYANKTLEITTENDFRAERSQVYLTLSDIYELMGNSQKALDLFRAHKNLEDSIYRDENKTKIAELSTMYELREKDTQIELQKTRIDRENQILQRNKIVLYILVLAVVIVLFFVYYLFRQNKRRKRTNSLLNEKNELIEEKNHNITQSILYARKIQNAILPAVSDVKKSFPESFIFYKPKDIVSGDFYWHHQENDMSIIAAVDCTGHGVPGAFMSMMANDLLNQIVLDEKVVTPSVALTNLDARIKQNLKKGEDESESRDGLDISLCVYNHQQNLVEYSGAKNDLYLLRDGQLIIHKANRYSIGGSVENKTFKDESIQIQSGDEVFLFTDGLADQFGGEKDKKYSYKRFRELLISISNQNMSEKEKSISETFESWKGNNEQLDDICIIGIKF